MNIDITRLNLGIDDFIEIDETYTFSKEELQNTEIIKLDNLKVIGTITKNSLDEYIIDGNIKGIMVLPCSITLKPIDYKINTNIEENIDEFYAEISKNFEKGQKTIDILPIIWENILMEIPIKVVSDDLSDIKTKGDGWELITDED